MSTRTLAARAKRDREDLAARKKALRQQYATAATADAVHLSKERDSAVAATLKDLQQSRHSHRRQTRSKQHRFQWLKEAARLRDQGQDLERALDEFMQSMPDLYPIVQVESAAKIERQKMVEHLAAQHDKLDAALVQVELGAEGALDEYQGLVAEARDRHNWLRDRIDEEAREQTADLGFLVAALTASDGADAELPPWWEQEATKDRRLAQMFEAELEALSARCAEQIRALQNRHAAATGHGPHGSGGWDSEDHFRFKKIVAEYAGGSRAACFERLALELGDAYALDEIQAHWDWYARTKTYKAQRRATITMFAQNRQATLTRARDALQETAALAVEARLRSVKQAEFDRRRAELRERVEEWRVSMQDKQEQERREMEARMEREEQLQREASERDARERQAVREQIDRFRAERDQRAREADEERAREEALQEAVRQKEIEAGKPRVEFRAQRLQEKHQRRLEQLQEELELEQEREARLARLRAQVAVEAEADPERVWQPTVASAGAADKTRPLFAVNGFVSDKITRDPRYRIQQALQDAGLAETEYGRQIISTVAPPRPPRPDAMSSEGLGL